MYKPLSQTCRGPVWPACILLSILTLARPAPALAGLGDEILWVEEFADDPIAGGRFFVPGGHDPARFTYDAPGEFLTVHYDTFEPTAWYVRTLDSVNGRSLDRYDDFEFSVTFQIRSLVADPSQFAQIGWALLNAATTGEDRAGGTAGPFSYDLVGFDYYPNVSPQFGGPTLGPTAIHSDDGSGFFSNIDFPFGAESLIDPPLGEDVMVLDTEYVARVAYTGADQSMTLTIRDGGGFLSINTDGTGGPGGFDGDATTIQNTLLIDNDLTVDSFALTAWNDSFNPFGSSVVADVEISRIEFFAPARHLGDMNLDGLVDGLDVAAIVRIMLSADPDPVLAARGDFDGNAVLDVSDVGPFVAVLLER